MKGLKNWAKNQFKKSKTIERKNYMFFEKFSFPATPSDSKDSD